MTQLVVTRLLKNPFSLPLAATFVSYPSDFCFFSPVDGTVVIDMPVEGSMDFFFEDEDGDTMGGIRW